MTERLAAPRLHDIIKAIENLHKEALGIKLDVFESDWRIRWIVERGIEIISEASRRLPSELKDRHPEIPWNKIAAIGNKLRHEYGKVLPDIMLNIAQNDLLPLDKVCREELAAEQSRKK